MDPGLPPRGHPVIPLAKLPPTSMAVNLTAHARLIRAALPYLQASGAGRIVNIASTEAIVTSAGPSHAVRPHTSAP